MRCLYLLVCFLVAGFLAQAAPAPRPRLKRPVVTPGLWQMHWGTHTRYLLVLRRDGVYQCRCLDDVEYPYQGTWWFDREKLTLHVNEWYMGEEDTWTVRMASRWEGEAEYKRMRILVKFAPAWLPQ